MIETERRATKSAPEARSLVGGKACRAIGGLAAVFGRRSQPMQEFREVVEPSFFNKTIGDDDLLLDVEVGPLFQRLETV